MIRRKPLKTNKGLASKKPLIAKTPLKAKTGLTATKSLKSRSKRMVKIYARRRPLVEQLLKERSVCESYWDENCTKVPVDVHEIKARSAGGKIVDDNLSNYLVVCRYCHGMITTHPKEAHARGLIKWSWE
jgi:hypothetical protein